jgi:ABC-type multidrug transport system fused ATPase/permease subunit
VQRFNLYRRLIVYLRPYWRQVIIAYSCMAAATLLNLFVPQVIRVAIDRGLEQESGRALVLAGVLILAVAWCAAWLASSSAIIGEWLTHRVAYDLRNDFYTTPSVPALCLPRSERTPAI